MWPVPQSYDKRIPESGAQGSFWEDRYDLYNCGVDIFAPSGADVIAIDSGMVAYIGLFTSKDDGDYFESSKYIIIRTKHKIFIKYAGLSSIKAQLGDKIRKGDKIGRIGPVLNTDSDISGAPNFIQELALNDRISMLHLEMLKAPVLHIQPYFFGSFMGKERPASLLDPTIHLNGDEIVF